VSENLTEAHELFERWRTDATRLDVFAVMRASLTVSGRVLGTIREIEGFHLIAGDRGSFIVLPLDLIDGADTVRIDRFESGVVLRVTIRDSQIVLADFDLAEILSTAALAHA